MVEPRRYNDAVDDVTQLQRPDAPRIRCSGVYVIRNTTIDFIVLAEQDYSLVWNYYKAGVVDAILE
jgi:hypothetical protein